MQDDERATRLGLAPPRVARVGFDDGSFVLRSPEPLRPYAPLSNHAITQALPRIADLAPGEGLFVEALMSSIVQGDDAAKQRVRDFLEKRAAKVEKTR